MREVSASAIARKDQQRSEHVLRGANKRLGREYSVEAEQLALSRYLKKKRRHKVARPWPRHESCHLEEDCFFGGLATIPSKSFCAVMSICSVGCPSKAIHDQVNSPGCEIAEGNCNFRPPASINTSGSLC